MPQDGLGETAVRGRWNQGAGMGVEQPSSGLLSCIYSI